MGNIYTIVYIERKDNAEVKKPMESAAMKSKLLPLKRGKKKAFQSWTTMGQWLLLVARQ